MEEQRRTINIGISTSTFIKIGLAILIVYFLWLIKDVLAILFIALLATSALAPFVDWMQKKRIPRAAAVIIIYFLLFAVVGLMVYLLIPPIAQQVKDFSENSPAYLQKITSGLSSIEELADGNNISVSGNLQKGINSFGAEIQNAAEKVLSTVVALFGGIVSLIWIMVVTFYMLVEEGATRKLVFSTVPKKYQDYVIDLLNRMQKGVGNWMRGQIILCLIIFVLVYVGLLICGVKYALVLALIAGFTEFVPYLGPIIAAIPAVFLSFTQSPILALVVLILYYAIQWTENHIIVPQVMKKMVGLNPVLIIVVMMVGFKVGGIVGTILAIPVATAASIFIRDFLDGRVGKGPEEVREITD